MIERHQVVSVDAVTIDNTTTVSIQLPNMIESWRDISIIEGLVINERQRRKHNVWCITREGKKMCLVLLVTTIDDTYTCISSFFSLKPATTTTWYQETPGKQRYPILIIATEWKS